MHHHDNDLDLAQEYQHTKLMRHSDSSPSQTMMNREKDGIQDHVTFS